MGDLIQISVLIPAFNEAAFIAATIESVHRSFAEVGQASYEIVVCDNNSTDATAAIAGQNGARIVFESHNQIARARNAAARAAQGEWLIFLDADTKLNAGLLRATLDVIQSGTVGGGGAVVRMDAVRISAGIRALLATWNRISVTFRLAAGAYVYCRRDAWTDTKGFDEDVYVSEEIWFSRRLKAWCRERHLRFQIITTASVVTSARKLEWYTPMQILKQLAICCWPRAIKHRRYCGHWYTRPVDPVLKED